MSNDQWESDAFFRSPNGEAGGQHVLFGATKGYAKPLNKKSDGCPRAAHEKIASDLAFDLGVPVPPVVLWRRSPTASSDEVCCSISAIPFDPLFRWSHVETMPTTSHTIAIAISDQASAMTVFDAWVDNKDRCNHGNLLVSLVGGMSRAAYIDYSFSLSYDWGEGEAPDPVPVQRYPSASVADKSSALLTLRRIEALREEEVRAIVDRVPEDFLSDTRKNCIADGLIRRRMKLSGIVDAMYGVGA